MLISRLVAPAVLLVALGLAAPSAQAGPTSPTTAAVSMGDSYISGEAGRWLGNSIDPAGSRDGTDRACVFTGPACTSYDKSRVYVGGSDPGCHRSDVAELLSARLAVDRRFNIACSGAVTKNLFRAADGGVGQNGEAPEADQLLPIARANDVRLIQVSIGGNDLGFASIIQACLTDYEAKTGPCEPAQQKTIDAKLPAAIAGIEKAIDQIRLVMSTAGYKAADYRLVLQTYPSVAPRASEARYPETGPERTAYGCPFYDNDLNRARDHASKQIGGAVRSAVAARPGTEILGLEDAFQGREFCAKTTREATPLAPPDPVTSEWGRFLGASTVQQGDVQEAFHPDAYGQMAFGACLTLLAAEATPGVFSCTNTPGQGPGAMRLARVRDLTPATTTTTPAKKKAAARRRAAAKARRRAAAKARRRAAAHRRAAIRPRFTG